MVDTHLVTGSAETEVAYWNSLQLRGDQQEYKMAGLRSKLYESENLLNSPRSSFTVQIVESRKKEEIPPLTASQGANFF